MNRFRNLELIGFAPPPFFLTETSIFDIASPSPDLLDLEQTRTIHQLTRRVDSLVTGLDLEQATTIRQLTRRVERLSTEFQLQSLSDRVAELEKKRQKKEIEKRLKDRKYTWTAEVEDADRKYKWTAVVKDNKEASYKWTAEIKDGEGRVARKYLVKVESADKEEEKKCGGGKKHDKERRHARVVEIQDNEPDRSAVVLKQAFAKRAGKKKELSPQDAAMMIQMTFRAYLIRRSQALRALRELAVAKAKLKEIRILFNNFSYRRRLTHDAEERQRFSEKIIVLLLTVDAIEGADILVRAARRSMIDELEAMLDVVDPQPQGGRSLSMRRRTFDMPDGSMQKELAAGVAQVVRMIDHEHNGGETFEACV